MVGLKIVSKVAVLERRVRCKTTDFSRGRYFSSRETQLPMGCWFHPVPRLGHHLPTSDRTRRHVGSSVRGAIFERSIRISLDSP